MTDRASIDALCGDFADVISGAALELALTSDAMYMRMNEIKFLLKNIRELLDRHLYSSFSRAETLTVTKGQDSHSELSQTSSRSEDRQNLLERQAYVEKKLEEVKDAIQCRLVKSTLLEKPWVPRVMRLCSKYKMSEKETDLFHLMTVVQGSAHPHVLNSMVEDSGGGGLHRMLGMQRVCEIAEVEMEIFCDSERIHVKEGMVLVEEENGIHYNLRSPRTAVQLLYGRPVR